MQRALRSVGLLITLTSVGCGGAGGASSTPTTPSVTVPAPTPTPAPAPGPAPSITTLTVVSSAGSGAFSPNPAQVPSGGSIVWRNNTGDLHVLVMNDGTPIATLAPGASVTTMLSGTGGDYRCTTHPSMVGSINGQGPPDPPAGEDDY